MLRLVIPGLESFDNESQRFVTIGDRILELEHSLASLSEWESRWEQPFLSSEEKTQEQVVDYVKLMTRSKDVDEDIYDSLDASHYEAIGKYINHKYTATTIAERPANKNIKQPVITAEIIYFWMISLNIEKECEHWHLNKLITLIKVCNEKNSPKKKMGRREILNQNRELNARRKSELNTRG